MAHVWWVEVSRLQKKLSWCGVEEPRKVGFSLSWRRENIPELELESWGSAGRVETPDFGKDVDKEFYMAYIANTFPMQCNAMHWTWQTDCRRYPDRESLLMLTFSWILELESLRVWGEAVYFPDGPTFNYLLSNKLTKLGDAIAISKSETMNHSLTDPLTHLILKYHMVFIWDLSCVVPM